MKLLRFKKGESCSLQYHNHRSELWCFLMGDGVFWRGGEADDYGYFIAKSGDSMLIPQGSMHKFRADKATLVLEIQYGERCVEEDIVRV